MDKHSMNFVILTIILTIYAIGLHMHIDNLQDQINDLNNHMEQQFEEIIIEF